MVGLLPSVGCALARAQAKGARVVILQTWGWLTGKNPYFANYLTMQARHNLYTLNPTLPHLTMH